MESIILKRKFMGGFIISLFFFILGGIGLLGSLELGYTLAIFRIPLPQEFLTLLSILFLLFGLYVCHINLSQIRVKPFCIRYTESELLFPAVKRPWGWTIVRLPWATIHDIHIEEESYGKNICILTTTKDEPYIVHEENLANKLTVEQAIEILQGWRENAR